LVPAGVVRRVCGPVVSKGDRRLPCGVTGRQVAGQFGIWHDLGAEIVPAGVIVHTNGRAIVYQPEVVVDKAGGALCLGEGENADVLIWGGVYVPPLALIREIGGRGRAQDMHPPVADTP